MKRERSRAMSLPDQVISRAERLSRQEDQPSDTRLYLSTGCTLLNLAISDDARKGWPCGKIVNPIGDSDTGKTILAMTAMAEAAKSPFFLGHKLIYADIEEAIAFDVSEMFGEKLAKRLKL